MVAWSKEQVKSLFIGTRRLQKLRIYLDYILWVWYSILSVCVKELLRKRLTSAGIAPNHRATRRETFVWRFLDCWQQYATAQVFHKFSEMNFELRTGEKFFVPRRNQRATVWV